MSTPLDEALGSCQAALKASDPGAAWQALRPVLQWPGDAMQAKSDFQRLMAAFAQVSRGLGAEKVATLAEKSIARPDDPQVLYDLGYELIEAQLPGVSAAVLGRANRLRPGAPSIVTELCTALEQILLYGQAALMLEASGLVDRDPFCTYLSGFCWLMVGDLERPRARVAWLQQQAEPSVDEMRQNLADMLTRADALLAAGITLDERSLTAWHAVLQGTILLHESPYGHPEPMGGRYAFLGDSAGAMRSGLERLAAVLASRPPLERVVAAPDRASTILGLAAAARLGLPFSRWAGEPKPRGLVVAWTLEQVEDQGFLSALAHHAPDQVLFVHASCWTEPFPYSPDVTTLLYQHITSPFLGGAMRFNQETGKAERQPPDPRSDEDCAAEITAAPAEDGGVSGLDLVVRVTEALSQLPGTAAAGLRRAEGRRRHQRAGSPVLSARFN